MDDITRQLRESCFCEGRGCELCRAADEIDRLRAELAKADGQINRCVDQNKYLESTISRLREYAKHRYTCHIGHYNPRTGGDYPCNCGYDELIKEIGNE